MLTQERLKELLFYNPETGIFTWKVKRPKRSIGSVAGCVKVYGYRYISVDGTVYFAHRLAVLYMEGYVPENEVDHINRRRDDNRYGNLREATRQCNARNCSMNSNNSSLVKGVHYDNTRGKWFVQVGLDGPPRFLGRFGDFLEAAYHRYAVEQCMNFQDYDINSSAKQFIERRVILDHWGPM